MKNRLLVTMVATATIIVSGKASAQIPVTDIASISQGLSAHVVEYANMAAQYAQQIQQYTTQVQQYDLQEVASRVYDTGQFDSTMDNLDSYDSAFSLNESKSNVGNLQNFSEFGEGDLAISSSESNLTAAGSSASASGYLERLGQATDRKLEISKSEGELVTKRMDSIEADRENLEKMQEANANAEGEMQAAQIGNHINSEVVGQMVKMRQEQAAEAQMRAEKEAIDESIKAEEQARRVALLKAEQDAAAAMKSRPKIDSDY